MRQLLSEMVLAFIPVIAVAALLYKWLNLRIEERFNKDASYSKSNKWLTKEESVDEEASISDSNEWLGVVGIIIMSSLMPITEAIKVARRRSATATMGAVYSGGDDGWVACAVIYSTVPTVMILLTGLELATLLAVTKVAEKDGFSVRIGVSGGLVLILTIYTAAEVKSGFISRVERWRLLTVGNTSAIDRWMLPTMFFDGMTLALMSARCEASYNHSPDSDEYWNWCWVNYIVTSLVMMAAFCKIGMTELILQTTSNEVDRSDDGSIGRHRALAWIIQGMLTALVCAVVQFTMWFC